MIAVFPLALMMMIMMKALYELCIGDNENQKRNIFLIVSLNSINLFNYVPRRGDI